MDYISNQIQLFHRLFLICLVLTIIFLTISVFLFIRLDMKDVIGYLTGHQAKREIDRLKKGETVGKISKIFLKKSKVTDMDGEKTRVLPYRRHFLGVILWVTLFFCTWTNVNAVEDSNEEQLTPVLKSFEITSGSDAEEDALIEGEENLYYARNLEDFDDIKIEIQIEDMLSLEEEDTIKMEYLKDGVGEWELIEAESWENTGENLWNGVYLFDGADEETHTYTFRVSYQDEKGNGMSMAEDAAVTEVDGAYISIYRIVIDKRTPSYTAEYSLNDNTLLGSTEDGTMLEPYYCSKEDVNFQLVIDEENLDGNATTVRVLTMDANGKEMENKEVVDFSKSWTELWEAGYITEVESVENSVFRQQLNLKFTAEGHYRVEVLMVDKSGNKVLHEKAFAMDKEPPEIVSWCIDGNDIRSDVLFGYFSKNEIVVHIKVRDAVSGVKQIGYTYEDLQEGISKTEIVDAVLAENDKTVGFYEVTLPYSFKGDVKAYGIDNQENAAEEIVRIGVIAESEETHKKFSSATIRVQGDASKISGYYKDDVKILFTSKDGYSGLNSVTYLAGLTLDETVQYDAKEGEELVTEEVKEYTILASENNENDLPLELKVVDNAGYETVAVAPQVINIDITVPKITVEYDNHDVLHEKYYKEERIATVSVEERNFDPKDAHFELTGPDCEISGWTHTAGAGCTGGSDSTDTGHKDTCVWSSTVAFREDGDYCFGFHCVDLAGNEARYEQVDKFIIDTTAPIVKAEYDNQDVLNEYYYNASRTATITIEEHNFDSEDITITMTAKDNGTAISAPTVSTWSADGDLNRAMIRYDYDGEFTFDIEYIDLAGNEAADYEEDHFVVDLTEPGILITEIEPMSANNDVVAPVITVTDTNFDHTNVEIVLDGYQNGVTEYQRSASPTVNGEIVRIQDIERVQEMDDLYTLTAMATDLAGNLYEESIVFSVNRFGSVYTFDKETENLVGENGKYYTNREQKLVVTETNVDTLEFQEITCNLNGKLKTLEEGKDFNVTISGTERAWKQYTYRIDEENFEEEGIYVLTIYSEDRATNASDNHSKGKKIEFAVDKTSPSVLISGVADNEQYRESSREITIDVEDNIRLAEVKVTIDGEETLYSAAQVQELDGKLTMKAGSANHWQEMSVQVFDAAGNEKKSEKIRFLITPDLFVQFYMNKPLFFGAAALILGAGVIWWFVAQKKKKNKNKI